MRCEGSEEPVASFRVRRHHGTADRCAQAQARRLANSRVRTAALSGNDLDREFAPSRQRTVAAATCIMKQIE